MQSRPFDESDPQASPAVMEPGTTGGRSMYHTTPSLDVKSPFSSFEHAIEEEELVDVSPLVGAAAAAGVELSVAITAELWDRAETLPFALIGRVTPEDRVRDIVRKSVRALERAREYFGDAFEEALGLGFAMDFAVSLPCRASDRRFEFARHHCKRGEDGRCWMTIGAPSEFSEHS